MILFSPFSYTHPYQHELDMFRPDLSPSEGALPAAMPPSEASLVRVSTEAALDSMLALLKKEKVVAVDLEHHWFRSYQGFTSLVQVTELYKI